MKKKAFGYLGGSVLLAALGYYLRGLEVDAIYPTVDGLTLTGTRETWLMGLVSAAVVLSAAALGIIFRHKNRLGNSYREILGLNSPLLTVLYGLCGLVICAAVVMSWRMGAYRGILGDLYLVVGCLAGVSVILRGILGHRQGSTAVLAIANGVVPLFLSLLLVLVYKRSDNNPQLAQFAYDCLAVASLALCAYYAAGFGSNRNMAGRMLTASLCAPFFVGASMADRWSMGERAVLLGFLVVSLMDLTVYVCNARPRVRRH